MDGSSGRRRRVLARVALYAGAFFVGLPVAFSLTLTRGARQPVLAPPAPFEELRFASLADAGGRRIHLRAWLLRPADESPRATVVVAHGLGDSLENFVGLARRFAVRGHAVLLVDLRGHGGSDDALTTLGAHESADVRAALGVLRARGLDRDGFVLLGNSMGAVAVLLASAGRDDVRAVIAEAPFDSYRETVAHHARLFYRLPRWMPLIPMTIAIAEWRAGFDADDVDVLRAAARLEAPLLLIADGADERMPERVVRRVFDAHAAVFPGRARLWVAPGASHSNAGDLSEYWLRVFGFLESAGL